MLPPGEEEPGSSVQLGSGRPPRSSSKPRSIFDLPGTDGSGDPMEEGKKTVDWVKSTWARLLTEGTEIRCCATALGLCPDVFPRLSEAMREAGVSEDRVLGVWVVPPFILKDLDALADSGSAPTYSWHAVRGRLGPFLKNNLWRRIDAEARAGRPIAWQSMGLQPQNVVLVKQQRDWRSLARRHLTRAAAREALRASYAAATRDNLRALLVRCWPFRWSWLVAWYVVNVAVLWSQQFTRSLLPVTWHDTLMHLLANFTLFFYHLKARAEPDGCLSGGEQYKAAGSIALRKGKLDVAAEQYLAGEAVCAKLSTMWSLNSAFLRRGVELRVACLNNAAIVRLKQQEWAQAAHVCEQALALGPPTPLAAGKAHFRLALARAKQSEVGTAIRELRHARALVPGDREIEGMLRVLSWGEERRGQRAQEEREAADVAAHEAELRARGLEPELAREIQAGLGVEVGGRRLGPRLEPARGAEEARARAAFSQMTDPHSASDASDFRSWAAQDEGGAGDADEGSRGADAVPKARSVDTSVDATPRPAAAAAATPKPHPAPQPSAAPTVELKFAWAKSWLAGRLVGLTCQDEAGDLAQLHEMRGFGGEARLVSRPRGKARQGGDTLREYDLHFELGWKAQVRGRRHWGQLCVRELASHADLAEVEVEVEVEAGPEEGTADQLALVGLLGPLRMRAALETPEAEGRLSQQLWKTLAEFRAAFDEL